MYGMQVDQDINCRVVGRCTYGATIDRELLDLAPREMSSGATEEEIRQAPVAPLSTDLGRAFLYARYNADLSPEGLATLKLGPLDAAKMQKMDAVENIENLLTIGQAVASQQVRLEHFGSFVS